MGACVRACGWVCGWVCAWLGVCACVCVCVCVCACMHTLHSVRVGRSNRSARAIRCMHAHRLPNEAGSGPTTHMRRLWHAHTSEDTNANTPTRTPHAKHTDTHTHTHMLHTHMLHTCCTHATDPRQHTTHANASESTCTCRCLVSAWRLPRRRLTRSQRLPQVVHVRA